MTAKLHFGYKPNQHVCSCGLHFGCGLWTPEQRADNARRMRETMPGLMPPEMKAFLADWEKHHSDKPQKPNPQNFRSAYAD